MNKYSSSPEREKSSLLDKVNQLRRDLSQTDPTLLADKAGATFVPEQNNAGVITFFSVHLNSKPDSAPPDSSMRSTSF